MSDDTDDLDEWRELVRKTIEEDREVLDLIAEHEAEPPASTVDDLRERVAYLEAVFEQHDDRLARIESHLFEADNE
jgi:hypothetical protein